MIKTYRANLRDANPTAKAMATFVGNNFGGVTKFGSLTLKSLNTMHSILGSTVMEQLTTLARKLTLNNIPQWHPYLPSG